MKYLPYLFLFLIACDSPKPAEEAPVEEPVSEQEQHWSNNSTIYEANLRQMTAEGTFKAFQEQHLDRLQDLGVEIIWFMPIHPIGEKERKGTMGSYYAVQDYKAVNPEHGTMEDFKALVDAAHEKGMKVIIDWVANHTAWDNVWLADHPDWYTKDSAGNYVPPVADWSDVMDLNYDNMEMRQEMINSMKFWLTEADIDGFRCDVAEMVPTEFWVEARKQLDEVKPIFFLAEGEPAELHEAFDMTYAWSGHHLMNEIARGEKGATELKAYWKDQYSKYSIDDYRMQFITNHDENSWNGTAIERMGDLRKAFAVMSFTVPGMPLIYSGQEADMSKRLQFFEKDTIEWGEIPLNEFYRKLTLLKTHNEPLFNGEEQGSLRFIDSGNERVISYIREKEGSHVFAIMNFSDEELEVSVEDSSLTGDHTSWFVGSGALLNGKFEGKLGSGGFAVLVKK